MRATNKRSTSSFWLPPLLAVRGPPRERDEEKPATMPVELVGVEPCPDRSARHLHFDSLERPMQRARSRKTTRSAMAA